MQFRKILVPTDFSEYSREALAVACDLARKYGAALTLMHVVHVPSLAVPEGAAVVGAETIASLFADAHEGLALAKDQALSAGAGPEVATETAMGLPYREIVRLAREGHFDLIVLGTHGRSGLKRALLGSVSEMVVRKAHLPVLAVPIPQDRDMFQEVA